MLERILPCAGVSFAGLVFALLTCLAAAVPLSATAQCVADAETLCLNDGRFALRAEFQPPDAATLHALAVPLTSDTGYFWFFNEANVEIVVKVLDACVVNDHFWVFAGGLTNVRVVMRVVDTATGGEQVYANPQGRPFQPVQDTGAFATCDGSGGPDLDNKPNALPPFASVNLYAADSPLNAPIGTDPELDPNSAVLASSLTVAGELVIQVGQFSSPVYFASPTTPLVDVELACGPVWELGLETLSGVPIPDFAEPAFDTDGAGNPAVGCGEDSDQDNHMVVLDPIRRCEYDFWQMRRRPDGQWVASFGNSLSMDSNGIYPRGLSSRGSGFAFLGGLIWPDELAAGEIPHALVFSYPFTKDGGPVAPATDSDGTSGRADALPEGARLQLDPTLDLDSLGLMPYERTIARALQEYGMYLVDNGGSTGIGLYAIDPRSVVGNPYAGTLPGEDFVALPRIPLDRFQVLRLGPQNPNWQQELELVDSGCATFR